MTLKTEQPDHYTPVKDMVGQVIRENEISSLLSRPQAFDEQRFDTLMAKALELKGLSFEDVAFLIAVEDDRAIEKLTDVAMRIKEAIYGRRLVLFAPMYTSNYCTNNCLYCGFRTQSGGTRRRLSLGEIRRETEALVNMGHKRVLMVAGEDAQLSARDIAEQVEAIYSVKLPKGDIRRVNVNIAPTDIDSFRTIKASGIGTYQCFQETYHRDSYKRLHLSGPKSDYDYRLHVFDRCITAGIDDFGMGFLFGLYDWRFELLAMLQHIAYLEKNFGIGPHTLSIPRIEPAEGTEIYETTDWRVSDTDIIKATAILRMTVPYTGIILSTREGGEMRNRLLHVGVSQMSAGSIINPGGYAETDATTPQFAVQDERSLDTVIREACKDGFIPSFCTGCYRKGRTGEQFQELAKHQHIHTYCGVNALTTLAEYLEDFASPETRKIGETLINVEFGKMPEGKFKEMAREQLGKVRAGERDLLY